MAHEEQNDPVAQSSMYQRRPPNLVASTADLSERDIKENPVVKEEGLIKVKIKKKKPTQLSTLNHSHAVVAPQRDSSTHHTPLHHFKVHPPHAAGWRTKSKMAQ